MRPKHYFVIGAVLFVGVVGLQRHIALAASDVSFKIHNNQGKVATLEVYDASDMNNPNLVKTIKNLDAGATTGEIKVAPIPGSDVGRANWNWDGKETNKINVSNGGVYELSSGAEHH